MPYSFVTKFRTKRSFRDADANEKEPQFSFGSCGSVELRVVSTYGFEDFDPALQSLVVLFERADQIIPQFPLIPLSKNFAL
jgi:hypothetical protein